MAISSVGTKLEKKVGSNWVAYAEITGIEFSEVQREALQIASVKTGLHKRYIPGFRDAGSLSITFNYTQALYDSLIADYNTELVYDYRIVLPDTNTIEMQGFLISAPLSIQIGQQLTISASFQLT